jgi:FkbM family methyltransferase
MRRLALELRNRLRVTPTHRPSRVRRARPRPGDLVFDIGAHFGQHTEAMLAAGAGVVAFEPQAVLARRLRTTFPAAVVLQQGAADEAGHATLRTSVDHPELATLTADWADINAGSLDGHEIIELTTLDALIEQYSVPALVKVDTEGLEDRVLLGLSRPINQLLVELHASLPDVAKRTLDRLEALGRYEYVVMYHQSWQFGAPLSAAALKADLSDYGDVWARRVA